MSKLGKCHVIAGNCSKNLILLCIADKNGTKARKILNLEFIHIMQT